MDTFLEILVSIWILFHESPLGTLTAAGWKLGVSETLSTRHTTYFLLAWPPGTMNSLLET